MQSADRSANILRWFAACMTGGRSRTLCATLLATALIAAAIPLINAYIVYPAFNDVVIQTIHEDAKHIGAYLLPPALKHTELSSATLTKRLFGGIYRLESDFGLWKLKIFAPSGEILYSTNTQEVGQVNSQPYFHDQVAKGQFVTTLVKKDATSLEGVRAELDVIETYVPIMYRDRFLGAFEMYFDVTKPIRRLNQLSLYSGAGMVLLSISLIAMTVVLLKKEISRKMAEQQAEQLKAEVERITRHDLKAPIIGMLSGLNFLESYTELDDEQAAMIREMREASNMAVTMINRSLDLYKMEVGSYDYSPTTIDLFAVLRQAASNLSGLATPGGVSLLLTYNGKMIRDNDTLEARMEETLLYSVLTNLLKNGIEASTPGDRVTVTISGDDPIGIAIHNPAPVPAEVRDTFFDKAATFGKPDGTGLGTYSARLMITTMGGTITMNTSDKDGTLITLSIPRDTPRPDND